MVFTTFSCHDIKICIKLLFGPGRDERICGLLWTLTSLLYQDQIKLLFGPGRDERICGLLWTLTSLFYQDQIKLLFGPGRHERICGLLWTRTSLLYQDQIKLLFGPGRHERTCGLSWATARPEFDESGRPGLAGSGGRQITRQFQLKSLFKLSISGLRQSGGRSGPFPDLLAAVFH